MDLQERMTSAMGPRPKADAFTARFGEVWREVEEPLRRYLASLGLVGHEIDDVVQEVAARALTRRVPFTEAADLRAWCFVVGRRIRVDHARMAARSTALSSVTGVLDPRQHQALGQVEDRHLLGTVREAMGQLAERDRDALVACQPASRRERNRAAVARHRARQRLKRLVGPFAVLPGIVRRSHGARVPLGMAAVVVPGALAAIVVTQHLAPLAVAPLSHAPHVELAVVRSPAPASVSGVVWSGRRSASAVERAARVVRGTQTMRVVARVDAPNHTHASVVRAPNKHNRPLVCTSGTVVRHLCVDVPHPLGPGSSVPR